jgi:hypothetical protein
MTILQRLTSARISMRAMNANVYFWRSIVCIKAKAGRRWDLDDIHLETKFADHARLLRRDDEQTEATIDG